MIKICSTLLLLLILPTAQYAQGSVDQALDAILGLDPSSLPEQLNWTAEDLEASQSTIKDIRYWKEKKRFSGEARFGFNGVTTRSGEDNLFSIYGGISMDWELYPGNLDFNTMFGVTYSDGELRENVSQIDVSYDHLQTNVANGRFLENYVYMTRATDAYIGIDQRYEIGGGIILNHWIEEVVPSARGQFAVPLSAADGSSSWAPRLQKVSPGISPEELAQFNDLYQEAYTKHKMAESRFRIALLAGLFYELEKATVNDSLSLDATNSFRMTLRPTLDIQLKDGWKLKIRQYMKMPMPWDWKSAVTSPNGLRDSRGDFRVDLNARITTQLLSKRVEIGFIYNLTYDNAPPRTWYTNGDGIETLVVNNDLNQSFRVSLNVQLDK